MLSPTCSSEGEHPAHDHAERNAQPYAMRPQLCKLIHDTSGSSTTSRRIKNRLMLATLPGVRIVLDPFAAALFVVEVFERVCQFNVTPHIYMTGFLQFAQDGRIEER